MNKALNIYGGGEDSMPSPTRRDFPSKQELDEGLDTQIRVFVPSTYEKKKKLSASAFKKRIQETVNYFTRLFGGSTRYTGIGSYTSEEGVIIENVAVIEAFAKGADWNRHDDAVKHWLSEKKKNWGQETLGFEWQQELIFV